MGFTYQHLPEKILEGTEDDAKQVACLLRHKFGFKVDLLLGESATYEALAEHLNRIAGMKQFC